MQRESRCTAPLWLAGGRLLFSTGSAPGVSLCEGGRSSGPCTLPPTLPSPFAVFCHHGAPDGPVVPQTKQPHCHWAVCVSLSKLQSAPSLPSKCTLPMPSAALRPPPRPQTTWNPHHGASGTHPSGVTTPSISVGNEWSQERGPAGGAAGTSSQMRGGVRWGSGCPSSALGISQTASGGQWWLPGFLHISHF